MVQRCHHWLWATVLRSSYSTVAQLRVLYVSLGDGDLHEDTLDFKRLLPEVLQCMYGIWVNNCLCYGTLKGNYHTIAMSACDLDHNQACACIWRWECGFCSVTLNFVRSLSSTLKARQIVHNTLQVKSGVSHLYVSPLKPLVGVEDVDTNCNTSCALLWYSTTMQHPKDNYHNGKVHKLSRNNKKHDRISEHSVVTELKHWLN